MARCVRRPLHREWMRFGKGCANRAWLRAAMSSSSSVMPQGGLQQLPELAAELVRLKVDVFQASGDLAPRVASKRPRPSLSSHLAMTSLGPGLSPVSHDRAGT